MRISDICTHDVVTLEGTATLMDAARLMRERHVGSVVIVDPGGDRPIGIVTDRDIVVGLLAHAREALDIVLARDLCARPLVTARHDEAPRDVLRRMRSQAVRRLPVLDGDGRLCGLIAADDILVSLADQIQDLADLSQRERMQELSRRP